MDGDAVSADAPSGVLSRRSTTRQRLRRPRPSRSSVIALRLLGVVTVVGALASGSSAAAAASTPTQKQLESEINAYASLLSRLGSDIQSSTTLSTDHERDLNALSTATVTQVNTLVAKVEIDTSPTARSADADAIDALKSRFAVLSTQVFETLEADDEQAQYGTLYVDETSLDKTIAAIYGTPSYQNAVDHYRDFVSCLDAAQQILTHIATSVLTHTVAGFPGNASVFSRAAANLSAVQEDLSRAAGDEEIIGLSFGGYEGR
jgi:hypothetical protein